MSLCDHYQDQWDENIEGYLEANSTIVCCEY